MTLTEFLKARLDEDERRARNATRDGASPSWEPDGREVTTEIAGSRGTVVRSDHFDYDMADRIVRHIARHDPARVLREVEAMRKIVELHLPEEPEDDLDELRCQRCEESSYPCATACALATVWSGHPDYDPAWATP